MVTPKPTASETSVAERQTMIVLTQQGHSAAAIAARLGCSTRTVYRWRACFRKAGEAGLQPRSRRPHTPHPWTTPAAIVKRICAIRAAHPGWGARLIRRQLQLEQISPVPHERTVQVWLRRRGYGRVQPQPGKRLGWSPPAAPPSNAIWQIDHKQKGGCAT